MHILTPEEVRALRKKKRWSQAYLGKRIGKSNQWVSNYETRNGNVKNAPETNRRIMQVFGILDELPQQAVEMPIPTVKSKEPVKAFSSRTKQTSDAIRSFELKKEGLRKKIIECESKVKQLREQLGDAELDLEMNQKDLSFTLTALGAMKQ